MTQALRAVSARRTVLLSLLATGVVAAGCAHAELRPDTRERAEAAVAKAEKMLSRHFYSEAQEAARNAYLIFDVAAPHDMPKEEIGQQEPVLWARLLAVDTRLDALAKDAPTQLPRLADEPDIDEFVALAHLVVDRQPLKGTSLKETAKAARSGEEVVESACRKAASIRLARSDLGGARRLARLSGCDDAPRLVATLLEATPGCAGFDATMQVLSKLNESSDDLRDAALIRGDACVKELASATPDRLAELAKRGSSALSALRKLPASTRDAARRTPLEAALNQAVSGVQQQASSQDERRLAQARADLSRAVAAKDVATACTLVHQHHLPVPEELRSAEKAAIAKLEPHVQKTKDSEHWPATAFLHNLWLGRVGQARSLPSAVNGWAEPLTSTFLDWSNVMLDGNCGPSRVYPVTGERRWRVIDFRCEPAQGQKVTTDIYETYTATAPLLLHGETRGMTYQRKVGSTTSFLNARSAAVTIVVAAPFADGELKFGVTRVVRNTTSEAGQGFSFDLRVMANRSRDEDGYDIPVELHQVYLAEVRRLADSWRQLTKDAKDDATREEAFARLALMDGKDKEALAYFQKRYTLTGPDDARTLSPPEVPKPCP